MANGEPTLIGSVQRALRLVNEVGGATHPLNAKELSSRLSLPLPTTYHLLRTLVFEGYLQRVEEGYVLGDQLTSLAPQTYQYRVATRVRPILNQLHDEAGAAAYLAMWDDGEIVVTEIVDSPAARRVDLWVGMDAAGHATAVGKAVLAALDSSDRREYLASHELADLTAKTITDPRELLTELRNAAPHSDREEYALGNSCLAMPIRCDGHIGAVGISFPTRKWVDAVEHSDAVRVAAQRIGRALDL